MCADESNRREALAAGALTAVVMYAQTSRANNIMIAPRKQHNDSYRNRHHIIRITITSTFQVPFIITTITLQLQSKPKSLTPSPCMQMQQQPTAVFTASAQHY
jgi:hypothetical protein